MKHMKHFRNKEDINYCKIRPTTYTAPYSSVILLKNCKHAIITYYKFVFCICIYITPFPEDKVLHAVPYKVKMLFSCVTHYADCVYNTTELDSVLGCYTFARSDLAY